MQKLTIVSYRDGKVFLLMLIPWILLYSILIIWARGFYFFLPTLDVLSGQFFSRIANGYFSRPFNIIHAGCALDQPTIGKFLILYTLLSIFVIGTSLLVQLISDFSTRWVFKVHCVIFILSFLNVLCFLTGPASLLYHYIYAMGYTQTRINGIVYILTWQVIWCLALIENLFAPKTKMLIRGCLRKFWHWFRSSSNY